jgi:hypothetical protein
MSNYIDKLPEDARQVCGAMNWVDKSGNLYGVETRTKINKHTGKRVKHKHYGKYFKYNTFVNNHNGYVYGNIKYIKDEDEFEIRQRRIHIIVAETFLENPDNLPIVGHRNNIKTDNRVDNLYWTTWQENTQKAFAANDNFELKPVYMFNTHTNELLGNYENVRKASLETGIELNTILRQAKYKRPVRKPIYFRFQNDESVKQNKIKQ